mgnify:FL=1
MSETEMGAVMSKIYRVHSHVSFHHQYLVRADSRDAAECLVRNTSPDSWKEDFLGEKIICAEPLTEMEARQLHYSDTATGWINFDACVLDGMTDNTNTK